MKFDHFIIPLFVNMINVYMSTRTFPSALKSARVNPLLKSTNIDVEQMSSYRTGSRLSYISKLSDNVVASQIA